MTRRWPLAIIALVFAAVVLVLLLMPKSPGPRLPSPDTSVMQPRVASAISAARRSVQNNPRSAETWGHYGSVLDAHMLYEEAETCYRNAGALDPASFKWAYLLAIVTELRAADAATVIQRYETARNLLPNFPPLYVRYGDALARYGRLDDALRAHETAIRLDEQLGTRNPALRAMASRSLGQLHLSNGDARAALPHLQQAASLSPRDGLVYAALAQAYHALGDAAAAERSASHSQGLPRNLSVPDPIRFEVEALGVSSELCVERAERLLAAQQWEQALANLLIVEETRPDDPAVQRRIAQALTGLGRHEEAAERNLRARSRTRNP